MGSGHEKAVPFTPSQTACFRHLRRPLPSGFSLRSETLISLRAACHVAPLGTRIPCHMTWSLRDSYGAFGSQLLALCASSRCDKTPRLLDGPRLVCDVRRLAPDAASEERFRRPDEAGGMSIGRHPPDGSFRATGGSLASARPGLVRKAVRHPKAFWSILGGQRTCRNRGGSPDWFVGPPAGAGYDRLGDQHNGRERAKNRPETAGRPLLAAGRSAAVASGRDRQCGGFSATRGGSRSLFAGANRSGRRATPLHWWAKRAAVRIHFSPADVCLAGMHVRHRH